MLALLGENGAGKSTLIKVLGGAHRPDAGTIASTAGRDRSISGRSRAQAGIAVIYQEFNLVPGPDGRENIFLGQETRAWRLGSIGASSAAEPPSCSAGWASRSILDVPCRPA